MNRGKYLALGIAIGCGLGVVFKNIALGAGLGILLGVILTIVKRRGPRAA